MRPARPAPAHREHRIQRLNGTITPNGLHFERHHSGIPDIDPDAHRLLIHGLVKRPLDFTLEALARYPMETRIAFIECGGNAARSSEGAAQPTCRRATAYCPAPSGRVSGFPPCSRKPASSPGQWLLAEGADGAGMSRSVPLAKAMDEALVVLYQNGERVRPVERLSAAAAVARL